MKKFYKAKIACGMSQSPSSWLVQKAKPPIPHNHKWFGPFVTSNYLLDSTKSWNTLSKYFPISLFNFHFSLFVTTMDPGLGGFLIHHFYDLYFT